VVPKKAAKKKATKPAKTSAAQATELDCDSCTIPQRRVLIGVAGGTASGKTLIADRIGEELSTGRIAIIKQDSYYKDISTLPIAERQKQNFDHPDAFDMELLITHLRRLMEGRPAETPVYDFKKHLRMKKTIPIEGCQIIMLEGILILDDPILRALMDIKVYVDTDADVRLMRRIRRDVANRGRTLESVLTQYENDVRPMHMQFVEPSKRYADIIIPEGGHNRVAIDLLVTKIRSILSGQEGAV
jgi:uridine kinase